MHHAEFDIGGFLLHSMFVAAILGFTAAWLFIAVMEWFRLTRYVWHLPLFFVGVACLIAVLLALLF
jgi:cell division protein FtsW (lipid II flippase)